MRTRTVTDGFCYLRLFETYNAVSHESVFHVGVLRRRLGRYPELRFVLAELVSHATMDVYLPAVYYVGAGTYHVDVDRGTMLLSELVSTFLFVRGRIGGKGETITDECYDRNQMIKKVSALMEGAGVDLPSTLKSVSRQVIRDECSRDGGNLLRDVVLNNTSICAKREKSFVLNFNLTLSEIATLQSDFRDLNVVVSPHVTHPHGFAAAATVCAEEFILRRIGYHSHSRPLTADKDVFLVDVGANWYRHVVNARFNIHCCNPIVDHRDSAREKDRKIRLTSRVAKRDIALSTFQNYTVYPGSKQRCFRRTEKCKVKANFGILIHSQYDMSLDNFLEMCDSHEFDVVHSVLIFDLTIAYKQSGVLKVMGATFCKKIVDGRERIFFDFKGDPSMGYSHDYAEYMRLITAQVMTTPCGRTYFMERNFLKSGLLFLKATHCEMKPENCSISTHFSFWSDPDADPSVVISSWEYDDAFYAESAFNKKGEWRPISFRRIFLEVPERLWELILSHCVRSGDKSFNLNEIFSAATSFNSRMTINGNDIRAGSQILTADLLNLVVAAYCVAYRMRYRAGRVIEGFTKQEKERRNCRKIGFSAISSAIFRSIVDSGGIFEGLTTVYNRLVKWVQDKKTLSEIDVELFASVRKIEYLELLTVTDDAPVAGYDVHVNVVNTSIDDDGVIVDRVTEVVRRKLEIPAKTPEPACDSEVETDSSFVVVPSHRSRREVVTAFAKVAHSTSDRSRKVVGDVRREAVLRCDASTRVEMPGDGHCLFHALAHFVEGVDAMRMREILYAHASEREREDMRACLVVDGSNDGWGTTDMLPVFSRVFGVGVCVHGCVKKGSVSEAFVTRAYCSGDFRDYLHLEWIVSGSVGHVNLLLGDQLALSVPVVEPAKIESCDVPARALTPDVTEVLGFSETVLAVAGSRNPKDVYDKIHAERMSEFGDVTANLLKLNRYVNRSAYKLEEIVMIHGVGLDRHTRVLDLGGAPGGFLQVCARFGVRDVVSVSVEGGYNHSIFPDTYNIVIQDVCKYTTSEKFTLVLADAAVENSYLDDSLFRAEMDIALSALSEHGNAIIKHNNYFSIAEDVKKRLTDAFASVEVVKPVTSRAGNSEVYLVCKDFSMGLGEYRDLARERMIEGVNVYYESWLAGEKKALPIDKLRSLVYGRWADKLVEDLPVERMVDIIMSAGSAVHPSLCQCLECQLVHDGDDELLIRPEPSLWLEKARNLRAAAVRMLRMNLNVERATVSRVVEALSQLDTEPELFNACKRTVRWCEKISYVGLKHDSGLVVACDLPKDNIGDRAAKVCSNELLDVFREKAVVKDMVRPGDKSVSMPGGMIYSKSYGVAGKHIVAVEGAAVDVKSGTRLVGVSSDVIRGMPKKFTVRVPSTYVRTVSTSGSRVQVEDTRLRPEADFRVVNRASVSCQTLIIDAAKPRSSPSPPASERVSEWLTKTRGGSRPASDDEMEEIERSSVSISPSVPLPFEYKVSESSVSADSSPRGSNDSTESVVSGRSFRSFFSKVVPKHRFASVSDVEAAIPRAKDGRSVQVLEYVTFPSDAAVAISMLNVCGTKVSVGSGMKRAMGLKSSAVPLKELRDKFGIVEIAGEECYVTKNKDVLCILVNPKESRIDVSFSAIFRWYDALGGARVAYDGLRNVGALVLCDLLLSSNHCAVFHNHRGDRYNYLLDQVNRTVAQSGRSIEAFPKLGNADLGVRRTPEYFPGSSAEIAFRNAMLEFRHVTSLADGMNAKELEWYLTELKVPVISACVIEKLNSERKFCYDNVNHAWVTKEPTRDFNYGYCEDGFVKYIRASKSFETKCRYVLVTKFTEIMLNEDISRNIDKIDIARVKLPKINWVNGVPGCGKTKYVIENHIPSTLASVGDLVLTTTKEGVSDIRKRVAKLRDTPNKILTRDYRTVASVLVNGCEVRYNRVFVDEALMIHAGALGFVAALSKCEEMILLGDVNQIPYVDRDHVCANVYLRPSKFAEVSECLNVTYRCPVDVAYALRGVYPDIHSTSACVKSMSECCISGLSVPKLPVLYLVHYQADKDHLLREGYDKLPGSRVLTVNEAQGLTAKHVICVRTQVKPLRLFDDRAFAIVAISRHTEKFEYYTVADDAITKLIRSAKLIPSDELERWNLTRRLGSVGYVEGFGYFDRKVKAGVYEDALTGVPHHTHAHLRYVEVTEPIANVVEPLKVVPKPDRDIGYLQVWYDDKLPGAGEIDYTYDQEIVEHSNICLSLDSVTVVPTDGVYMRKKYDRMRPKLRTLMGAPRVASQRESVLGALKRNLNAPKLTSDSIDPVYLGKKLFRNFVRSVVPDENMSAFEGFVEDTVRVSPELLDEWLEKQPPAVRKNTVSEEPYHLRRTNVFNFMIKSAVKPALEISAVNKYASVQTIAYLPKHINALFCPVMNVLSERMYAVMSKKIMIMTGMSNEEFECELNKRVDVSVFGKLWQVENDMSKYDKAQGEALLVFEALLFTALGMDPEDVEVWVNSHRESIVRDRRNGVRFSTKFQRKSGDASTFFGNTMVLLAVLVACYNIDDVELLLAAGDDSVIFFREGIVVRDDPSLMVADLFNLECKLLDKYEHPYFCSKFVVIVDNWIHLVPDLLKFVTKLGRRDLVNAAHVEEYRVSCLDSMKGLFNEDIIPYLNECLNERYGGFIGDATKVIRVINTYVSDSALFASLYVSEGLQLCEDPSRPKLD